MMTTFLGADMHFACDLDRSETFGGIFRTSKMIGVQNMMIFFVGHIHKIKEGNSGRYITKLLIYLKRSRTEILHGDIIRPLK